MKLTALLLAAALSMAAQVKDYRPSRLNLFSPAQDVELGKEAAAEVRQTMPVINNAELTGYVNRVGRRLSQAKKAGDYPYTFEVVNDPNINAFALPGGPVFVNTGLLAAVGSESELAGVLAHEISHVYLRHGTNQVSKANLIQLPAMLGAAMLGSKGGIWGTLGELGIGLSAQSLLLRYSRDAEKESDLNGAQIMNEVGYDPAFAASFFQKLEAQSGSKGGGALENFFSSHPAPGNRVKYVSDQNKLLPKRTYSELEPQNLGRVKQIVASLPAPPKPSPAGSAGAAAPPSAPAPRSQDIRPSGRLRQHRGRDFALNHPDNWEVFGDANADTVTVAPRAALVADNRNQTHVAYGFIAAYFYPQGNRNASLKRDTNDLVKQIQAGNPSMQVSGAQRSVRVAGQQALVTPLQSPSPFQGQREVDMLVTVARPQGLFYMVFIAPESEWTNTQATFDEVVRSLQFTN